MKIKSNGNFQEKAFENLGIPQDIVLFYRKLCKFPIFCSAFHGVVRKWYLFNTVHNDFIAIGALNTETFVFQDGLFGRVTEAGLYSRRASRYTQGI